MNQEIFDAIHSFVLLKEEKDVEFFLRHRRQQIDKIEEAETTRSRYTAKFKNPGQPFYDFDYAFRENGRLVLSVLNFNKIRFYEVRKVFSRIEFGFVDNIRYMTFIKNIPQGILCFSVMVSDSLTADDYGDIQEGVLREEKLHDLLVGSAAMHYGKIFKEYQFMDSRFYEQD